MIWLKKILLVWSYYYSPRILSVQKWKIKSLLLGVIKYNKQEANDDIHVLSTIILTTLWTYCVCHVFAMFLRLSKACRFLVFSKINIIFSPFSPFIGGVVSSIRLSSLTLGEIWIWTRVTALDVYQNVIGNFLDWMIMVV